jgi:DUF1680 family protein
MIPYFGKFRELSLRALQPAGWLREGLQRQRDGLTGHLEVAGYPFDTAGWRLDRIRTRSGYGRRWWPYEQYAYWVDGMTRCGFLLRDPFLIRKARRQLDHVLRRAHRDGYLGPACLKTVSPDEKLERWPHAVFFRALLAYYGATGKRSILDRLVRHYRSGTAAHGLGRNVCNVEIMCRLHELTGDRRLVREARTALAQYQRLQPDADTALRRLRGRRPPADHGVNFIEISKQPALLYLATGDRALLGAAVNAFGKLKRHHQLLCGVPSSTEHLRGINSLAGFEICNIADYTWSLGYLLMATGRAEYADHIERACLNAAPGAVTKDFKALQYFSSPNQVVADRRSNHHLHGFGHGHMSYRPNPATECCPGNVNRALPNYVARQWLGDGRGGLVAALYGPSEVTHRVGDANRLITLREQTDYPFSDLVRFEIARGGPVRFTLWLRIPGWCRGARLSINGQRRRSRLRPGTFIAVRRVFRRGDVVELRLPMSVRLSRWPEGGVAVERGPLVYALPIREHRKRDRSEPRSSPDLPAWNLYPAGPWNYALAPGRSAAKKIAVRAGRSGGYPWETRHCPVTLEAPVRRVPGWRLRRKTVLRRRRQGKTEIRRGLFLMTPPLPSAAKLRAARGPTRRVTLVPYGCTQLRIALFPRR